MHITFHYAIGVICAAILSRLTPLSPLLFCLVIAASIFPDLDIIFSKFALNLNHRMLITHSLYFPLILFLFGIVLDNIILIFIGISYFSHVFVDLLDWGTNFFYNGKIYGFRFLLKKEEYDHVPELLQREKIKKWFFVRRYYHSKLTFLLEISIVVIMGLVLLLMAPNFWYFVFGYPITLSFHIMEYYYIQQSLKRDSIENN